MDGTAIKHCGDRLTGTIIDGAINKRDDDRQCEPSDGWDEMGWDGMMHGILLKMRESGWEMER